MSDSKKDSLNKKINIKNKKEATKVLNKNKNTITKAKKKPQTKTKQLEKKNSIEVLSNEVVKETPKTKQIKKVKETKTIKKVKETKEIKKSKTKKPVKKEEKAKLVLPKEWQAQNIKVKKTKKNKTEPDNLGNKLKSKIFEEVSEQELRTEKLKNKEKNKKILIIFTILLIIVSIGIFAILKYNDSIKKQLKIYDEYVIGDRVVLKDNTIWYVIEDSNNTNNIVKLIKETQIDINQDGKFDNNDKKKYNASNIAVYDETNKDSVAYYLSTEYKLYLNDNIGEVETISILTSKEFVKARSKMGYGYEWQEGNWLANNSLDSWWINSSQNEKVYAVTKIGSYKLYNANSLNYVRPVIIIEKELVKKDSK